MKKVILVSLITGLTILLTSCAIFNYKTEVIQLLNTCTQEDYNNLSVQQKVWLKYYCDIHKNNMTDPQQTKAVKRGLTLYKHFMNKHKNEKRLQEKFKSNYEYLKGYSSGLPSYPED